MSWLIPAACRALHIGCEAAGVYNTCNKLYENPENRTFMKVASAGMEIILLTASTAECGALAARASNQTLSQIKMAELTARFIDWPLKAIQHSSERSPTAFIEKGFVSPFVSILRVACEADFYEQKASLDSQTHDSKGSANLNPEKDGNVTATKGDRKNKRAADEDLLAFEIKRGRMMAAADAVLQVHPVSAVLRNYRDMAFVLGINLPPEEPDEEEDDVEEIPDEEEFDEIPEEEEFDDVPEDELDDFPDEEDGEN